LAAVAQAAVQERTEDRRVTIQYLALLPQLAAALAAQAETLAPAQQLAALAVAVVAVALAQHRPEPQEIRLQPRRRKETMVVTVLRPGKDMEAAAVAAHLRLGLTALPQMVEMAALEVHRLFLDRQ